MKISQNDIKDLGRLTKEITVEAKSNPAAFIKKYAQDLPENTQVALYFNNEATEYFVIPFINDDFHTSDEFNQRITAGLPNCIGSVSSFACASTFGSVIGETISTLTSLSTVSTGHAWSCRGVPDSPTITPELVSKLLSKIRNDVK